MVASFFLNRGLIFANWCQYLMLLWNFIPKFINKCSIYMLSSSRLHFRIYSCCIWRFIIYFFVLILLLLFDSIRVCIIASLKTKLLIYVSNLLHMALSVDLCSSSRHVFKIQIFVNYLLALISKKLPNGI